MTDDTPWVYEGFGLPAHTQIPNDFLDDVVPRLKEGELRVMLYVMRRTFGFGKHADRISIAQFCKGITTRDGRVLDSGTGMSRSAVVRALDGCVAKGLLTVGKERSTEGDYEANIYALRFRSGVVLQKNHVVLEDDHGGSLRGRGVVLEKNPQKKEQKTENKKSYLLKLLDEPLEPAPRKGIDREAMVKGARR